MENTPHPHARAGQPPCIPSQGTLEIPAGGMRKLTPKHITPMKNCSKTLAVTTVGCVLGICQSPSAKAVVSDEDFQKLSNLVEKLNAKVDTLEGTHEKDQQKINHLEQQAGKWKETRQKEAEAPPAPQPPAAPVPDLASAATHNVVLAGDMEVQYGKMPHQNGGFTLADFAPIFLFRASDNVLVEAGFDIMLGNNQMTLPNGNVITSGSSTTVSLSFAQIDYLLNDYMTIIGGDMLLPLGTYQERGAGWLNKIPDDPMARSLLPGSGVGLQLRGAVPVGDSGSLFTYSAYTVNGPSSVDGTGNSTYLDGAGNAQPNLDLGGNVGGSGNLHGGPSYGGRIGFFVPFSAHHDLEVGVSGQNGAWARSEERRGGE